MIISCMYPVLCMANTKMPKDILSRSTAALFDLIFCYSSITERLTDSVKLKTAQLTFRYMYQSSFCRLPYGSELSHMYTADVHA